MQGACGHHANACQRSYAWWWKPGLITLVYLHCCDYLLFRVCFHSIVNVWWWEEAQPKNLQVNFFLHGCHNLYFRRNHVADVFCSFRRNHIADCILIFSSISCRQCILMTFLDMETMQENFYYLKMHRWFLCFLSNLHVSGFSSCRITQMIHSCLVCARGRCQCVLVYTALLIHTYVLTHVPTPAHAHTCMHACIHRCIHTNTYTHTCMHTYIHTYMHASIHTYIHAYLHTYIHTYIHTCLHS